MVPQLRFSDYQIQDFGAIRDLGPEVLKGVAAKLNELEPPPLQTTKLLELVARELGDQSVHAESLTRQALAANGMMRQVGLTLEQTITGVHSALQRDSKWSTAELALWSKIESHFQAVVASRAVRLVANAIDLSYDYANLYRRARILTDIRPLFSESADSISGTVVSFTLRLRYDSVDGDHDLSLAMDEADVLQLIEQCQRALKKSQTARELMTQRANMPTLLSGESGND